MATRTSKRKRGEEPTSASSSAAASVPTTKQTKSKPTAAKTKQRAEPKNKKQRVEKQVVEEELEEEEEEAEEEVQVKSEPDEQEENEGDGEENEEAEDEESIKDEEDEYETVAPPTNKQSRQVKLTHKQQLALEMQQAEADNDSEEIEDMNEESGDENEDEQMDDGEDDDGVKKEEDEADQQAEQENAFSSTLSSLLSKPIPKSVREGREAPVLLGDRTLAARHHLTTNPARAIRRAASERKQARLFLLEKDHIAQPQSSPLEKMIVRSATKGVVTLFNAVQKQQKEWRKIALPEMAGGEADAADKKEKKKALSNSKFFDLLKSEVTTVDQKSVTGSSKISSAKAEATAATALKKEPGTAAAAGSSWKVLSDDYLIGNKMSDWDKQVHSSEDEDEDE